MPVDNEETIELNNGQDKFEYTEIAGLPFAATIKYSGNGIEGYCAAQKKLIEWMQVNEYDFGNGADCIRCYHMETPFNENCLTEMQVAVEKSK